MSLTLLVLSMSSIAQNLTFDEVLSLRKKSLSGVEEYLNARGWKFLEAAEPEGFDKLGNVTFTYKKITRTIWLNHFLVITTLIMIIIE